MGEIEDFEVDGVEWIDGSVQADLPFERISALFNVSNFVVSQTNFHLAPLLNNQEDVSRSTYQRIFQTIEWDIRSRALKLSGLGLFPKVFGHDISEYLHSLRFMFIYVAQKNFSTIEVGVWSSNT